MSMATSCPTSCSRTKSRSSGIAIPAPRRPASRTRGQKFVIAENLTKKDNVCIAAQDIDGDGKCEVAVGAEWNPGDTVNSGAVFYLIPPADRTQRWEPVKFPSVEPTTHRMKWLALRARRTGDWSSCPLHGRGNKNGEGAPVKVLLYHPPTPLNDPKGEWKSEVIDESMHMTHNFHACSSRGSSAQGLLLGGKEGVQYFAPGGLEDDGARSDRTSGGTRRRLPVPAKSAACAWPMTRMPLVTVEPMHGTELVVYRAPTARRSARKAVGGTLTTKLPRATRWPAATCSAQAATRSSSAGAARPEPPTAPVGVAVWTPLDEHGEKWRETVIDPTAWPAKTSRSPTSTATASSTSSAAGRATKNVKIYFNETPK